MKTRIFLFITGMAFVGQACDDYLDLKPISVVTAENAYSTADDAEAALVGAYDSFSQEYYIWDNIIFNDVRSDNHYAGGDDANIYQVDNLAIEPTNPRLFNNWSQLYNAIAKVNLVLDKVPQIEDPRIDAGGRRRQILGEASFLRAYHYYQLVKMWGDVPLITKPVSSTAPSEVHVERSPVAQVYTQIVADLEYAAANLPATFGSDATVNKARATRGAAHAMLAKVWAQRPDRDYEKVRAYADSVINSPAGYRLLDNYDHLWDGNHYNNDESIMEVQFVGGTEGNWGPNLLLGSDWRKFVTPSKDLVAAFDNEGDTERKNSTIVFATAPWADEFWSLEVGGTIPFSYKWRDPAGGNSTNRQYLLRLGDIVLLKAEAHNELGQLEDARAEIDRIRDRAGLGPTPAANQAEMRLAIENERRLELAQEAQRWDDLVRYGRAVEVMSNLVEIDLRTNQPKDYEMTESKILLPIPQSERNRNPRLGQNEGYN